MEVLEAIKTRRSIRTFLDTPIEKDVLQELVEAGVWAPSGGNMQTWRFIIVTQPRQLDHIRNLSPGIFGQPRAIIVVCTDMVASEKKGGQLGFTMALMDASMAVQNILLAAHDKGIGSCVIASFHTSAVQKLLQLPSSIRPLLLIILGYPMAKPSAPRREIEEVTWWEIYSERET
jgi:nitroreductase